MRKPHYIYAGWVVDGSGGAIQKRVVLKIVDSIIVGIERCTKSEAPPSCTDLSHCTILPPLVDCHVHLAMSGSVDKRIREHQLHEDYEGLRPLISQHLAYLLSHGVLAVRDGGDKHGCVLRYRNECQSDAGGVVVVKAAGRAWHKKGRYGGLIGRYPQGNETLAEACSQDKEPGDHVKLANSGLNSLHEFGLETPAQFSLEEIRDAVTLAKKKGQKVMVHANGREPVRLALEAGCHSIEHGFFMGRENLELMAEKGTVWVPTAYTMKAYAENMTEGDLGSRDVAEQNLQHQLKQISMARELGVTVALGTDSGSMGVLHGESVVEEMKLYKKAGFSLSETVRCATYNGAQLLGIEGMGILEIGKPAHFIVARGTPSQLPRKLSYLEAVFLGGKSWEGYRKNPFKVVSACP